MSISKFFLKSIGYFSRGIFVLLYSPTFRYFFRKSFMNIKFKRSFGISVNGHVMYANTLDRLFALFMWKFFAPENDEIAIFKKVVKRGDVVLDVGANIGYHTLELARLVGNEGRVYSFEPDYENYSLLIKNVNVNGYRNVRAFQKAVTNETGKGRLFISPEHRGDHRIYDSGDSREYVAIETLKLDDMFSKEGVDFIKMDIQGAEYLAFIGMEKLVKRNKGLVIICELSPTLLKMSGFSPKKFIEKLVDCGLAIKIINEKKKLIESISAQEILEMCKNNKYINLYLERRL